jgi:hypothetical protein
MRRLTAACIMVTLAVLAAAGGVAAPARAAPQNTGCPADFQLEPVSILGEDFTGVADNVNHDGFICIMWFKNREGGVFVDNTMP